MLIVGRKFPRFQVTFFGEPSWVSGDWSKASACRLWRVAPVPFPLPPRAERMHSCYPAESFAQTIFCSNHIFFPDSIISKLPAPSLVVFYASLIGV